MLELAGRIALVTGAASGLGAALAQGLAEAGMRVVLSDVQRAPLGKRAEDLSAAGHTVWCQSADVLDPESVRALVDAVHARYGALHLLVNDAGVMTVAPAAETAEEDWSWLLGVNLLGAARTIAAALPRMRERGEGEPAHIVNVASMSGLAASLEQPIAGYAASKSALIAYSEVLAHELEGSGIGVSIACPGGIATGIFASERLRPPAYRHAGVETRPAQAPPVPDLLMEPLEAARRIIDGVRRGRRYVFTHTDAWQQQRLETRWRRLMADFEAVRPA